LAPTFFNENVNRFNYLHFLQHELIGLLENIDLKTHVVAPTHSNRIVQDHLNLTFPDKWISRYEPIACTRFPNLTSPDFFL